MFSITLSLILACAQEQTSPEKENPTPTPQASPEKEKPKLKLESADPRTAALTPSPMETRLAAERAGITTRMASLIPDRKFDFSTDNLDHIAMRTGIILADTVLTIKELPKVELEKRMTNIEDGLSKMKAGKGLLSMVGDLKVQVTNDSLTRKELLTEMEDIVSMSVPENGFGKDDKTGPLLQAGAWLASINLLCKAIQKEDNIAAANKLLRHGKVADYFLLYTETKGRDKTSEAIIQHLQKSLYSLKDISEKDSIAKEDITKIITETDALLGLI
jgi:hypothetical protein